MSVAMIRVAGMNYLKCTSTRGDCQARWDITWTHIS